MRVSTSSPPLWGWNTRLLLAHVLTAYQKIYETLENDENIKFKKKNECIKYKRVIAGSTTKSIIGDLQVGVAVPADKAGISDAAGTSLRLSLLTSKLGKERLPCRSWSGAHR